MDRSEKYNPTSASTCTFTEQVFPDHGKKNPVESAAFSCFLQIIMSNIE